MADSKIGLNKIYELLLSKNKYTHPGIDLTVKKKKMNTV